MDLALLHTHARTHARTHVRTSGLCIDRQDMVGRLNPHADDGITWFESTSQNLTGGVAQNTLFSFIKTSAALAAVLRPQGKGIFLNVHTSRLDMMEHVDGIFDEHGDNPPNMALSGLFVCLLNKTNSKLNSVVCTIVFNRAAVTCICVVLTCARSATLNTTASLLELC